MVNHDGSQAVGGRLPGEHVALFARVVNAHTVFLTFARVHQRAERLKHGRKVA